MGETESRLSSAAKATASRGTAQTLDSVFVHLSLPLLKQRLM